MAVVKITAEEFDTAESKRPRALYWSRQIEQRVKNTPDLLRSECRQIIKTYCECMVYICEYGEAFRKAKRLNERMTFSFSEDYVQKALTKSYQKPVSLKSLMERTARSLAIDDNLEQMFTLQYLFGARNVHYDPVQVEKLLQSTNLGSIFE